MPYINDKPIKKLYFSIGEICQELHVSHSLIRYWCDQFNLEPKRSHISRTRQFTEADRITIREIYFLLKVERYTIEGALKKLRV